MKKSKIMGFMIVVLFSFLYFVATPVRINTLRDSFMAATAKTDIFPGSAPEPTPIQANPSGFNVLSLKWYQENTGYNPSLQNSSDQHTSKVTINSATTRNGIGIMQPTARDVSPVLETRANVSISNGYFEGWVRGIESSAGNNLTITNSTWSDYEKQAPRTRAVTGVMLTLRYNFITGREDGIVTFGFSGQSVIEYNWIKGPGVKVVDDPVNLPEGNHQDGIQFWQEGYTTIHGNRIEGWSNAAIMVKSDVKPRTGYGKDNDPISHVTITENYFGSFGVSYYYLRVNQGTRNPSNTWQGRPRYITITDNWFELKPTDGKYYPIFTASVNTCGDGAGETAIFVRTEAERNEGIARQNAHPEVLKYRESLGWHSSSVDARTWIVWNNNRYVSDGSEVRPRAVCAVTDKGWYGLTNEREQFASTDASLTKLSIVNATISPTFNANTLNYTAVVGDDVSGVTINATGATGSTVSGTGVKTLNYGVNTFNIVVTAEDGKTKGTYTIKITRNAKPQDNRSTDNTLKSLNVTNTNIAFEKGKTVYNATVKNSVISVQIDATASHDKAKLSGIGNKNLVVGKNMFTIEVIAENTEVKIYTVIIVREDKDGNAAQLSDNQFLSSLTINGRNIGFDKNKFNYEVEISNKNAAFDLEYELEDPKAFVSIEGNEPGSNRIEIYVTSESGKKRTYTINVVEKKVETEQTEKKFDDSLIILAVAVGLFLAIFVLFFLFRKKDRGGA